LGWLLHILSGLFRALPLSWAVALGAALGWLWHTLVPIRRSVARSNLRLAFPERSEAERRRIARDSYVQLGRSAAEFLRLPGLNPERAAALVSREGIQHLQKALAQGRGAIVATAHFGSFDLLACSEALRGLPLNVVTRRQHSPGVDRFWMAVRSRCGVRLLPERGSALRLHRLLGQNQVVALLIDQHMPAGRGIPIPFFGKPAATTPAPAVLALHSGAPILPASIERIGGGFHRLVIEPPVEVVRSQNRAEDVRRICQALNSWLERRIRERPDHWLWLHRRWKLPAGGRST
jgi:KDO2-lipid IV(A) lauroyltransferase